MITNFKLYEALNTGQIQNGDYVLCDLQDNGGDMELSNYVEDNIGLVVGRTISTNLRDGKKRYLYKIKYEGIDRSNYGGFCFVDDTDDTIFIWKKEINFWSNDKEDLESILAAKKYNL